jgi:DNA primase
MKNSDPTLDFHWLKEHVSIATVLDYYNLTPNLKLYKESLRGPCPLHGGDNPFAFSAHLGKNLWYCFTRCGGGDVVDLVRKREGGSYYKAARVLQRLARAASSEQVHLLMQSPLSFQPYTQNLALDPRTPFLQEVKGISIETARFFEAGVSYTSPFLRDMVAVRLFDLQGNPLGYAGRRLDPATIARWGKWRFPKGFPKQEVLFNAHRAECFLKTGLVVVECPWAAARLHQAGMPNVVALLGTTLSSTQARWLSQTEKIVALLDSDQAGCRAGVILSEVLEKTTEVTVAELPWGQEPEDLKDEELREIIFDLLPLPALGEPTT